MKEWLSLSKNTAGPRYLINESGKPVNLFGMARCQICASFDEDGAYGGAAGVARHFKNLGCNFIRLALDVTFPVAQIGAHDYVEDCGGYNPEGINKWIDRYVEPDVQAILNEDVYIMLDLHEYPPKNADEVQYAREHYIPIWKELAKRYRDEPGVAVFELWNEPYPADIALVQKDDEAWVKSIREFYLDAVREIREIDQKHIIMVSDYNAGWGMAWEICWKDYTHLTDPGFNNTCYSIHVSHQQLDNEAPDYMNWVARMAEENNVCLLLGEVETEPGIATEAGILHLTQVIEETADTHHLAAVLWRPHNDELNFVSCWTDFAKRYTAE